MAPASYPDHALSLQFTACALDYRLLSCPQPGQPWRFFFVFLLTRPLPLAVDWLLRHAALTTTHAHVVLHLATCSKQLASLLLLTLFVRQEASSIQHTGLVAQWLDLHFLNSAVPPPPKKKGLQSLQSMASPGWRSVVSSMDCGPPLWDRIPSVETFSTLAPCPWTLSPAHPAAVITRFGRRQALATKPLVPWCPVPCS